MNESKIFFKEKRAFDPCWDRASCQKPDAVVRERVAVEIYRMDVMTMSELSLGVGVYVEPSLPKRWYCASASIRHRG